MLDEIVVFLKNQNLHLSKYSRDGRINSAFNEDEIFKLISQKFSIDRPNARSWFDFSFIKNDIFYPINIKITSTKTSDNLNCKLGIYYALTGKWPPFNNGINYETYFQTLKINLQENDRDYYFLIVNKDNLDDIFYTSLKCLNVLQPNGNNLPFQAKWNENKIQKKRSFEEAKNFILSHFETSLKLRSDAHESFKRYFCEKC